MPPRSFTQIEFCPGSKVSFSSSLCEIALRMGEAASGSVCTEADGGRREIEGHGHKHRVAILFLQLSLLALQLVRDTHPTIRLFV